MNKRDNGNYQSDEDCRAYLEGFNAAGQEHADPLYKLRAEA